MPRPKKQIEDEQEEPQAFTRARRKRRMSIALDENGVADLSVMDPEQKSSLLAAMMTDEDTKDAFTATGSQSDEPVSGIISSEDMRRLLGLFSFAETWVMPPIIEARTKELNPDGTIKKKGIKLSPQVTAQAFTFNEKQLDKLCPLGAKALNEHLPEWALQWIAKTGPLTEFAGLLLLTVHSQMQTAILLQVAEDKKAAASGTVATTPPPPGSNGEAQQIRQVWP